MNKQIEYRMRLLSLFFGCLLVALLVCSAVQMRPVLAADGMATSDGHAPEHRIALVVGNGAYLHVEQLANPVNDATHMAKLFHEAGFVTVETKLDVGVSEFRHALADFQVLASKSDVAVIYYSGHGIEYEGQNYLIPIDAAIKREVDVQDEAVTLDRLLRAVNGASRLKLIILDSCRTDPFPALSHDRAISRGLVRVEPSQANELVAYAAKAGTVARDGVNGDGSPYTNALLRRLTTPGLDIELALRQVRDDVLRDTDRQQEPYYYGSMGGAIVALRPLPPRFTSDPVVPSAPPVTTAELWGQLAASDKPQELRDFLIRFPQADERAKAEARLRALDDSAWTKAATADLPTLARYLDAFPDGAHRNEASARVTLLEVTRPAPAQVSAGFMPQAPPIKHQVKRRVEHATARLKPVAHVVRSHSHIAERSVQRVSNAEKHRERPAKLAKSRRCFMSSEREFCE